MGLDNNAGHPAASLGVAYGLARGMMHPLVPSSASFTNARGRKIDFKHTVFLPDGILRYR